MYRFASGSTFEIAAKHSADFKLISKQGTAGTISGIVEDAEQQELTHS